MSFPQGRLQPAGAVRVLHRLGRRLAAGGLRHPGPPRRRPPRDHPRGPTGRAAGPLGRRLRGPRGEPVRLLHARHRDAPRRARRVHGRRAGGTSGRRVGAAGPPLPLHRLAVDRRGRLPRPRGRRRAPHEGRRAGCGPARRPSRTPRRPGGPKWRGPALQSSGPDVVLGGGGFADDTAPLGAPVQLGADAPLAPSVRAARAGRGRIQGRNSTVPLSHPVQLPAGEWALTLQTTWVEPAYVEPDASWCRPGEHPASPLANGGAFGGKRHSPVPVRARELADETGEAVRVLWQPRGRGAARAQAPPAGHRPARRRHRHGPPGPDAGLGRPRAAGGAPARALPRHRGRGDRGLWPARWRPSCAAPGGPRRWPLSTHWRPTRALPARAGPGSQLPGTGSASVELALADGERGTVEVDVWAGEVLCPVTLALLRARRRAPGTRAGVERGHRGRRRRRARRPHHPLLRHPRRARHARRRRAAARMTTRGRSTAPTPCSSPRWRRPGSPTDFRRAGPPGAPPSALRSRDVAASGGREETP